MKIKLCRRLFAIFAVLGAVPFYGQNAAGFHRLGQVLSRAPGTVTAQVVPNAKIQVSNSATGAAAAIYSDVNLAFPINPPIVTADSRGQYNYYVPPSYCVTETVSSPGQGTQVIPYICQSTSVQGAGGNNTQLQYNHLGALGGSLATADSAGNIVSPATITSATSVVTGSQTVGNSQTVGGNQTVIGTATVANATIGTAANVFNFNGVLDASLLCGSSTAPVSCGTLNLAQLINQSSQQLFAYTVQSGIVQYLGTITVAPGIHQITTPIWLGYGNRLDCQNGAVLDWEGGWGTVDGSGNVRPNGPVIVAGATSSRGGNVPPYVGHCTIINHGSNVYQPTDGSGNPNYTFGILLGGDPNGVLTPGCGTGASDLCGGYNTAIEDNTISGFNAGITGGDNFFTDNLRNNQLQQNFNGLGDGTVFPCGIGSLASGEMIRFSGGMINNNYGNDIMLNCAGHHWTFSQTSADYGRQSGRATAVETADKGIAAPANKILNAQITGDAIDAEFNALHCESTGGRCLSGPNAMHVAVFGGEFSNTQKGFRITGLTCSVTDASTLVVTANIVSPSPGGYFRVTNSTHCSSANGLVFNQTSRVGVTPGTITATLVSPGTLTPVASGSDTPLLSYGATSPTSVQIVQDGSNYYAIFADLNDAKNESEFDVSGLSNCTVLNGSTIQMGTGLGTLPYNSSSTQIVSDVTKLAGVTACAGGSESSALLSPHPGYYVKISQGNSATHSTVSVQGATFQSNVAMVAYCDLSNDPLGTCSVINETPISLPYMDAMGWHIHNIGGLTVDGTLKLINDDGAAGTGDLFMRVNNAGSGGAYLDMTNNTNMFSAVINGNATQKWQCGMMGTNSWQCENLTLGGVSPFSITPVAGANNLIVGNGFINVLGLEFNSGIKMTGISGTGPNLATTSTAAKTSGNLASWDANSNTADAGIVAANVSRYCGEAAFSASTTSGAVSCAWVTASSHCQATWKGATVTGGALGYTAGSATVSLTAATSNSGTAAVHCSAN